MNITCHAPCLESSSNPSHKHFAMYEKLFIKQKFFVLVVVKVRWKDSDKMLDNHPIFFNWKDSDNTVDKPPIYFYLDRLR